jgi:hypothetical protein
MISEKSLFELIEKLESDKTDLEVLLQDKKKYFADKILKANAEILLHLDRYTEYTDMLRIAERIEEIETKVRTLKHVYDCSR